MSRTESRVGVQRFLDSVGGAVVPSSCDPALRHHAEMELSLEASCSTHQSLASKSP